MLTDNPRFKINGLMVILDKFTDAEILRDKDFYYKTYDSMEKIWLACIMSHNHNKTWNGEDWQSEKK